MPEYTRANHVSEGENPIDSEKYEQEMDQIYAILNALEGMAIGDTPPSIAADGKFWLDTGPAEALYSVPMLRIYRTASGAWEWTGVSLETSKPGNPRKGAIHYTSATGVLEIYGGSAWVQFAQLNTAASLPYVNTTSGLTAEDVQAAIDELVTALGEYVTKATMDAQSVLGAVTDDTPVAIPVSTNQVVGRAGGNVGTIGVSANQLLGRAGGDLGGITVGENQVLARVAGGNIAPLTVGEAELLGRSTGGALASLAKSAVKTILGFIENLVEDTTPELGGALNCKSKAIYWDLCTISGATPEIDVADGNKQKWVLTADSTPTLAAPPGPTAWHLFVYQDASTAYTVAWPAGILWANGVAPDHTDLSGLVVVCIAYDGTSYAGSWAKHSAAA